MTWLPKSVVCLRYYDRFLFRSDLIASLVLALEIFPAAIAIAIASGLRPVYGVACALSMCKGVSPMFDALQSVEQIRSDLKPIETKISKHCYLRTLEAGRLQDDSFKVFAGQQYHTINSDLRSIAASEQATRCTMPRCLGFQEPETLFLHALGVHPQFPPLGGVMDATIRLPE